MSSTLIVHACGGAGISISDKVFSRLDELGEGFSKLRYHYIDSSRANIDKIKPKGEFFQIRTKANSIDEISGSGAERKKFAVDIMANVKEYLDANKYLALVRNEFHIVVFSASGGTGNIAGAMIIRDLVMRGIPTIAVVIGDSSNGLNCINTINSLASLNGVAVQTQKALSVIYINNNTLAAKGNMSKAEDEANNYLANIMVSVSLFLSGENEALDNQDMIGIIDQSNYNTIQVQPGLYGLVFYSKEIKPVEGTIPTVGRSLALLGMDFDTNLTLLHNKRGYVTSENAINIIKEENFPLHMISYANYFEAEEASLKKQADNYQNIMNSIQQKTFTGIQKSEQDDTTGLIF